LSQLTNVYIFWVVLLKNTGKNVRTVIMYFIFSVPMFIVVVGLTSDNIYKTVGHVIFS